MEYMPPLLRLSSSSDNEASLIGELPGDEATPETPVLPRDTCIALLEYSLPFPLPRCNTAPANFNISDVDRNSD